MCDALKQTGFVVMPSKGGSKEGPRIIRAEFVEAVYDVKKLRAEGLPEIAVTGRSNVGKSSLINALCGRTSLARTSSAPGRTRGLCFYEICLSIPLGASPEEPAERQRAYLVDLPGFGYAKVSKKELVSMRRLIEDYLLERESLCGVVLLVDCRRDPGEEELWISELGREGNLCAALTKMDKLSMNETRVRKGEAARLLGLSEEEVIPVSVKGGAKLGVAELTSWIANSIIQYTRA